MKKAVGILIKQLRERSGLSQQQLGDRIGVDKGNVSRYEAGTQWPEYEKLNGIAAGFGMSVAELLTLAEQGNVDQGPDIKGTVPLISWVQAGQWQDVIDELQPGEGERIPTTYKARRHTYALRVRNDSMVSTEGRHSFPEGCIIIVEPEEQASPGSFVIVRQNGTEATFKQLMQDGGRWYLKPLNPRYPIMDLRPDAVICGVVKKMEMDV